MGCTSSREAESSPPIAHRPLTTSTSPIVRALNPPRLAPSNPPSNTSTPRLSNATPLHSTVTPHHEPLEPPAPWSATARTWTPSQLARERTAFFETRVTGRSEVWAAISSAADLLRAGQLENARGVLEAAEVTLPTGSLVDGGYDTWGGLYRVPREVLSDPENIQAEGAMADDNEVGDDGVTVVGGSVPNLKGKGVDDDANETDLEKKRGEKGKGKAVLDKDAVKVRCRLSDRGGPDVVIMLGKAQTMGVLSTRVGHEAAIPNTARIRIAYLGKILDEKETLAASGWKEGHVLNALVVGQP